MMTLRGPGHEEYVYRGSQKTTEDESWLYRFASDCRGGAYGGARTKGYPYHREIPGVSPPELILLPPVREIEIEIEIVIDMVQETASTSTAPH